MPFEHEIRVTFGDCDPAKVAYTARIPWFALDAINGWWEHHLGGGWYHMELDRNVGTPFVRMDITFKSPVTPRHRLVCSVWPNRLGETSVGFHVTGSQNAMVCFEGNFVCVFTQADKFKKSPPPTEIRNLVAQHLIPSPADQPLLPDAR